MLPSKTNYHDRTLILLMVYLSLEIFIVFAMTSHTGFVSYVKSYFKNNATWMLVIGTLLIVSTWVYALAFRHVLRKYYLLQLAWFLLYLLGLCFVLGQLNTIVNSNHYVMAFGNVQFVPMIFALYLAMVHWSKALVDKIPTCKKLQVPNFDFVNSPAPYYILAFCDIILMVIGFATDTYCAVVVIAIVVSFLVGLYIIWKSRRVMMELEDHEALYGSILIFRVF